MVSSFIATAGGCMLFLIGLVGIILRFKNPSEIFSDLPWGTLVWCVILIAIGLALPISLGLSIPGLAVAAGLFGLALWVFTWNMNRRWSLSGLFILLAAVAIFFLSLSAGYQ